MAQFRPRNSIFAQAHEAQADFDQAFALRHVLDTGPPSAMKPDWELSLYGSECGVDNRTWVDINKYSYYNKLPPSAMHIAEGG